MQSSVSGLLGSMLGSFPELSFAGTQNNGGFVLQPDEGETYFVRENTPITIKISKKTHKVESISICTEEIPPQSSIPIHKHLNEDEMFYFHQGSGAFILDDREFSVSMGSTALVLKGTWHGFKNTGNEPVLFTFGYAPAGFEDFFRQIGTPKGTPFKAKPAEEFKAVAAKYGMVYK